VETDTDFLPRLEANTPPVNINLDVNVRYGIELGGIGLLYDGRMAVEVTDPAPVSPLPNTPAWVLGIVNLRGNLIPLFDLKVYFGMQRATDAFASLGKTAGAERFHQNIRFLVFGGGTRMAAILIDNLPARHQFPKDKLIIDHGLIPPRLAAALIQVRKDSRRDWYELDFDTLFRSIGNESESNENRGSETLSI
jgi:twitching motility protein PilI